MLDGLKWNTVQPGGALTGMEDEMTRRIVDVDYAMTYLEENPLPSTANSYRILLGGHYLLIFMRAVQVAITWIRASQKAQEEGQVPPAPETLVFTEDGGLLYRAVMHVDKWTDQYKMHRAQRLGIRGRKIDTWRIVSEEIPDLIRNTSRYMWYYSIESDVGGDELMDTLKPAWLGEFPDPINSAAQQSLAMGHIEEAWGGSLEGGQTEKVFRTEWGAIREASAINSSTM